MGVGDMSQRALSTEGLSSSCRSRHHHGTEMAKHRLSFLRDLPFDRRPDTGAAAIRVTAQVSNGSLTTWVGCIAFRAQAPWAFTCKMSGWEGSHLDILPEYSLGDLTSSEPHCPETLVFHSMDLFSAANTRWVG